MSDNIILEAKNVAVRSITEILAPHIYNGLLTMYNKAAALNKSETIKMFQLSLERIGILPENILKADYKYLISTCNETELKKNIEILFICYSKLTINKSKKIKKSDLEIPSNQSFLHQCYINAARDIYTCAHLFSHKYSLNEQAQHKERALDKISQAIDKTIRELIPYDTLFRKYITENTDLDTDTDTETETDNTEESKIVNDPNNLVSLMNLDVNTEIINKGEDTDNNKLNNENINKLQDAIKSKKEELLIVNVNELTNIELSTIIDGDDVDDQKLVTLLDENVTEKIDTNAKDAKDEKEDTKDADAKEEDTKDVDDVNEMDDDDELALATLNDDDELPLATLNDDSENGSGSGSGSENGSNYELVDLDDLTNADVKSIVMSNYDDTESFRKFKEYAKKLNIKDVPIHIN